MDIDLLDDMDLDDLDILDTFPTIHRSTRRVRINPFTELEDYYDFRAKYRFSKRFGTAIVNLIRDRLPTDPRGSPIPAEIQVACALRCWARHEIQDDTADLHGISQPTVSKVCKNVAEALARLRHQFIKMPSTIQEEERGMGRFRSIANFPQVIGAIDCTHIKVKKSNSEDGLIYINRKGYASINCQVVCNADLKIMDIVARWRGSVHDSRIFRESRLKQRFEAGAFRGVLLGDSGYPCMHYLFTPLLNPSTPQEQRYNRAHILTRNTIERCFGVWKQRFRCLLRGMFGDINTVKTTIVACAVLHNIAIDMREDIVPDIDDNPTSQEATIPLSDQRQQNSVRGNLRRRQLIESHF